MDTHKGMDFDATKPEYAFARILGKRIGARGGLNDADVFRGGDIKDLGKLMQATCRALRKRINAIHFSNADKSISTKNAEAGCKVFIDSSIEGLERLANDMITATEQEREDYHWLIIADLIIIIDTLMKKMEERS